MSAILQEIINVLLGSITNYATAFGNGLSAMVKAIFIQETTTGGTTTQSLSVFGGVVCIFAGLALCVGLSRWVLRFVSSLGARNG